MTSQQKIRVLLHAAIALCDRDNASSLWRETIPETKMVTLLEGKSAFLGQVRRIAAEVALRRGISMSEVERGVGVSAEYLKYLRRDRATAVARFPVLATYPAILTHALRQAEERFATAENVRHFLPHGSLSDIRTTSRRGRHYIM